MQCQNPGNSALRDSTRGLHKQGTHYVLTMCSLCAHYVIDEFAYSQYIVYIVLEYYQPAARQKFTNGEKKGSAVKCSGIKKAALCGQLSYFHVLLY